MDFDQARQAGLLQRFNPLPAYYDHLRRLINFDAIADHPQRLVVDSMYGSGRGVIKSILKGTGCEVREIRGEMNPGFGGVHPEPIAKYLGSLAGSIGTVDEAVVQLAEPAEPDRSVKLRFEIDGDFLVRPGGDNYWELGVWSWFPRPHLSGQYYTFHAVVRVKKPFVPFAAGVTVRREGEGDENVLEMRRRLQWAQIDLEKPHKIFAVLVWHAHDTPQIVHDVIVQVADDPDFTKDVRTIDTNDYDNSAGLGVGKDKEYFENYEGRLMDAKGVTARYLRSYTQGSTYTSASSSA